MTDDRGVVRQIAWRDLLPWLIIVRSLRVAFSAPVLLLAIGGVVLHPIGWRVAEVFLRPEMVASDPELAAFVAVNRGWTQPTSQRPVFPTWSALAATPVPRTAGDVRSDALTLPLDSVARFWAIAGPVKRLFTRPVSFREAAYLGSGFLWTLLVWSLVGGAINRIAVINLAQEERASTMAAIRHTASRFGSYFAAPLLPLAGALFLSALIAAVGLLMRADVGTVVSGIAWVVVLAGALLMVVLLAGAMFGWPLMWAALGAEGSDAFDAISRAFAYVYQRPLNYLFYALVAAFIGAFGYIAVLGFTVAAEELAWWSASWGAGETRVLELRTAVDNAFQNGAGGALGVGAAVTRIACGALRLVAPAFGFGFLWCASTAIYLLLRRDVDHMEFDEIYDEQQAVKRGLPSLGVVGSGPEDRAVGDARFASEIVDDAE